MLDVIKIITKRLLKYVEQLIAQLLEQLETSIINN